MDNKSVLISGIVSVTTGFVANHLFEAYGKSFSTANIVLLSLGVFLIMLISPYFYKLAKKYNTVTKQLDKYSSAGIQDILSSMSVGGGSASEILETVNERFYFMGIAGSKWINEPLRLQKVLRKAAGKNDSVKFLLLNPNCELVKNLSKTQHNGDENHIPIQIEASRKKIKNYADNGYNIELRLYDFLPIFRIAIVDETIAYTGFYRNGSDGKTSPQIVFKRKGNMSFYKAYQDLFEDTWKNNSTNGLY